jgi:hypothetical protein
MRKELGSCCTWAIAYALAGLVGNLVSIAVFDFYDPVRWPILLLPRLALFLPALAPLALVHTVHLRPRIGAGAAMAVPIAGLGGAVALIAFFAFYTDMVLNWREPYWATLLPRRLQLAAAIPGQLGLIGGAWFGVIETAVLRRVSRPRRGFLPLAAAIPCAIAIVVPYYFAAQKREAVWVMAALASLPLAGAGYGALLETVLRPDATPVLIDGTIERIGGKRLFARWALGHLVTALIGGLATMFAAFPVFDQSGDSIARYNASILIHPSALLPLAVAPVACYQAWALRKLIPPLLWLTLLLLVALPPMPYLLWFILSLYHSFAGPMITWRSFLLVLAMVGGLWTGAVLLPPMLLVGSFWRWLLQGGAALAIGAVAVYLAWSSAIDFNWWAWPAGIVAASLVFALLTYSLVRPALSLAYSSTPAPSPTDM